ncbi:hypothetical protein VIGAN_01435900 [Vigna angularis var. angularis]|uniref:Uncharacterized protein n=1 Tax=Vigna angularis var. angularis TaxID=157739 RepID=A0A0S3R772_PHAAN|nr:hypothetical protein VIGAN_01435900 [Vigna angularis var. angularis]
MLFWTEGSSFFFTFLYQPQTFPSFNYFHPFSAFNSFAKVKTKYFLSILFHLADSITKGSFTDPIFNFRKFLNQIYLFFCLLYSYASVKLIFLLTSSLFVEYAST